MRQRFVVLASILSLTVGVLTLAVPSTRSVSAQTESGSLPAPKQPTPKYVGLTKCAACHFDQYKDWKSSNHAKAFDILPVKYRRDAKCLSCHTTGGHGGGPQAVISPDQGVSCESCHGPGSAHASQALQFVNEPITEEGLRQLRGKIQRIDMTQCIGCHVSKAHKKHPAFDRSWSQVDTELS